METIKVGISQAKNQWSSLLRAVAQGDEVVITRGKHPIARLVSLHPPKRQPGLLRGKIWIADNFDDPLPESYAPAFRSVTDS